MNNNYGNAYANLIDSQDDYDQEMLSSSSGDEQAQGQLSASR